jgi:hypothetical protein
LVALFSSFGFLYG